MRLKALFLLFTLLFALKLHSMTGAPGDEIEVKQKIDQWYQQIGFEPDEVSPEVFETAVRGWFKYTKDGTIPAKNVMSIVNYKLSRKTKRWFIFQIGNNPKMLRQEYVAHGYGSQLDSNEGAATFGNVIGSGKSSRGFVKVGSYYNGKYGKSIKLHGLENGVNHKMLHRTNSDGTVAGRAVVIHGGDYARTSFSAGCLTLYNNVKKLVYDLVVDGTLIYASDEESHASYPFMGGRGSVASEDFASVPGGDNLAGPDTDPEHKGVESLLNLQGKGTPTGVFDMSGSEHSAFGTENALPTLKQAMSLGEDEGEGNTFDQSASSGEVGNQGTPFNGSDLFQDCQKRVCAPAKYSDVIEETRKEGGDPGKYFACGLVAMDERLNNEVENPYDAIKASSASEWKLLGEQCIAQARMMKTANFEGSEHNKPLIYKSIDGKYICVKDSPEAVDFEACKEAADIHSRSLIDRQQQLENQNKSSKEESKKMLEQFKKGDGIQMMAPVVAETLKKNEAGRVEERSIQQQEALSSSSSALNAMPNRESILKDCRLYMKGKNFLAKETAEYMSILDAPNKTIPKHPDPCGAVIRKGNTNMIQNTPARIQGMKILEKIGYKIDSLNEKERVLLNQGALTRLANLKGGSPSASRFDSHELGKFKGSDAHKFGFGKAVSIGDKDCLGTGCTYSGGGGLKSKSQSSRKRNESIILNNDVTKFAMYSPPTSAKILGSDKVSGSEKSRKSGIFQEGFYKNVYLALDGNYPVSKLSPSQKKEYNSLVEYKFNEKKRRLRSSSKTIELTVKNKKVGSEIWFDKKMDLFKIISNRYQKVFSK